MIVLTLLLAATWLLLTGEFTLPNLVIGLAASVGLLWLLRRVMPAGPARPRQGPVALVRQGVNAVAFGFFFIWELILANVRVAIDVLRPRPRMQPAVVAVQLEGYSDAQATLLANFITLTPGTLSLDIVQEDAAPARTLYVHAMHAGRTQEAIDRFRVQLQASIGRRVQEVIR
jgi:multicomponent Na+:H+ antiporter subunit E